MEVEAIVSFASRISTPLILAGVVVGVLWGVFKLVVQKSPEWAKKDSSLIIVKIINWIGVLALVSIIFGFLGFLIIETEFKMNKQPITPSEKTDYYKNLSDETIRHNITANLHSDNVSKAMELINYLKGQAAKQEEHEHILEYCAKNSNSDKESCKSIVK